MAKKDKRRVRVVMEFDTDLTNTELQEALSKDEVTLQLHRQSDVSVKSVDEPLQEGEVLVLINRHGESWPRHMTEDKGLAARWVKGDRGYRSVIRMRIDDERLLEEVQSEEQLED